MQRKRCRDRSSAVASEVKREQITEVHAIAVRDWRAQSAKTERKQRTVETVVLLSQRKVDDYVEVELDCFLP